MILNTSESNFHIHAT